MSAFLDLLSIHAIWFYLAASVGVLFGIKLLVDARRQARTTLFTLEQEQANDRAFRGFLIVIVFVAAFLAIGAINTFVPPVRPTPEAATSSQTVPIYTPPVILPTFTTVPTLTPSEPTPTETPKPTAAAPATTAAASPPPPTAPAATHTAVPTAAPPVVISYPAPVLNNPVDGSTVTSGRVHFRWDSDVMPATLPDGQSYKLSVYFIDRNSNTRRDYANCTPNSQFFTTGWTEIANSQGTAVNDLFYWNVIVVQKASPGGSCFDGKPISPPSETHSFKWP